MSQFSSNPMDNIRAGLAEQQARQDTAKYAATQLADVPQIYRNMLRPTSDRNDLAQQGAAIRAQFVREFQPTPPLSGVMWARDKMQDVPAAYRAAMPAQGTEAEMTTAEANLRTQFKRDFAQMTGTELPGSPAAPAPPQQQPPTNYLTQPASENFLAGIGEMKKPPGYSEPVILTRPQR